MSLIFIILTAIIVILTSITIYNYFTIPRLKQRKKSIDQEKLVSILIPARNEEENIAISLLSAINQTYQNTEIIVLDDKSTDKTSDIVIDIIKRYSDKKIKLYEGSELPTDWNGKSWACYNLANYSNGEYILFIDADVILDKNAVSSGIAEIQEQNLDLLTVFPTQIKKTFAEKIFVTPFMEWLLTLILPVKLSNESYEPKLATACGQYMFFKRQTYNDIGGHSCVGKNIAEEREISMVLKQKGYKVGIYLGENLVFCRMYKNLKSSFNGFANSFYGATKMNAIQFFLFITILSMSFVLPFFLVFIDRIFTVPVLIILLQRTVHSIIFQESVLFNLLTHPIQIIAFFITGITSYIRTIKGNIIWKGRVVVQQIK